MALAFSKNSFSILSLATSRRSAAFSLAHCVEVIAPLLSASRRSRSSFTQRPSRLSPTFKSRATWAIVSPRSITSEAASRRNSGVYLFLADIVHILSSRAKPDKLSANKTRVTPGRNPRIVSKPVKHQPDSTIPKPLRILPRHKTTLSKKPRNKTQNTSKSRLIEKIVKIFDQNYRVYGIRKM